MNFSVSARGLCILQDSERQIDSYMGHTLYFTLLLISLPLAFELLVCSMKWVGTLIMLNPGNITYHKSRLIHQKSFLMINKPQGSDIRKFHLENIFKDFTAPFPRLFFKSVSTSALGSRATCHLTDFNETLPV